jgi:hypothetical protein
MAVHASCTSSWQEQEKSLKKLLGLNIIPHLAECGEKKI